MYCINHWIPAFAGMTTGVAGYSFANLQRAGWNDGNDRFLPLTYGLPSPAPARYSQVSMTVSGLREMLFYTFVQQPFCEIGVVGRPLSADADVFSGLLAGPYGAAEHELDRFIAFVKQVRHQRRVAVERQGQLGHVVGANGETIEVLQELIGQYRIARHFAHHDQF